MNAVKALFDRRFDPWEPVHVFVSQSCTRWAYARYIEERAYAETSIGVSGLLC